MKKLLSLLIVTVFPLSAAADPFVTLTRSPIAKKRLPTSISVLTAEDIKNSGATTLGDVLDVLPAVDVSRSGSIGSQATVRVRGVPSSNQVQIVVDDQPLGGVSVQSIDAGLIPVHNIERVEVVRGGSSALYGPNTMGGIIHIFTKRKLDERVYARFGAEGQSHQTSIVTQQVGGHSDRTDAFFSTQKIKSDGYQDNSDIENTSLSANLGHSLSNGTRFQVDFFNTDQEQGTASGTSTSFDEWDGEKERHSPNTATNRINKDAKRYRAKASVPVGGSVFQSVGYYSSEVLTNRSSPGANPFSDSKNRIVGNDTRFQVQDIFTVGTSYERNERESLGQMPHHITNIGSYVQADLNAGPVTLIPAFRWDQHSTIGNQYNPRLSSVLQLGENAKLSGNIARTFRAPWLVDLFIVLQTPGFSAFDFFGNPNLKPEVAWTYDAGLEFQVTENSSIGFTGFFTRIRDRMIAVDSDGNGFVDTVDNVSRAEIAGVESVIKLVTGIVQQKFNHTFQRAKGTTATSSQFVQLRFTPKHLLNYQNIIRLGSHLSLVNSVQYVSRQYQSDGLAGIRLPSYTLWDARLSTKVNLVEVFVGVQNITDKLYAESITFGTPVPQPARTYSFGANIEFGPSSETE